MKRIVFAAVFLVALFAAFVEPGLAGCLLPEDPGICP